MYRDVVGPQQALMKLLLSIQDRLARIEKRVRWPGAVQFSSNLAPPALDPDAGAVFVEIDSVVVDPGTWLIFAGAVIECDTTTGTTFEIEARIVPTADGAATLISGPAPSTLVTSIPVVLQGAISVAAQTTLSFEVRYQLVIAGSPDGVVVDPYIIAVPA